MLRGVLNPEEADSLTLVRQIVQLLTGEDKGARPQALLQRSGRAAGRRRRGAGPTKPP